MPNYEPDPVLQTGWPRTGGVGQISRHVRERARDSFEKRLWRLEKIIDSAKSANMEVIRAMDLLGRYGLGTKAEVSSTTLQLDAASPEALRVALIAALGNPEVRAWLDTERPDIKRRLLAAGAEDAAAR